MAKKRKPTRKRRASTPRRRTVVVMNPPKRRKPRARPKAKPKRRQRRRAPRKNPSTTFLGGLWASAKGAGGGGLAYGLGFGVDYLPISAAWQSAAFFGTGFVTSVASSWLIDREFGAGMAGGVTYGTIGRVRAMIALRKLGEAGGAVDIQGEAGCPKGGCAEAGAVKFRKVDGNWERLTRDSGRIVVQRLSREAGAVFEARLLGRSKALRVRNQLEMPRQSLKTEGAGSVFAKATARRYGPHSWLGQLSKGRTYKEAGRVIRVVSSYNR